MNARESPVTRGPDKIVLTLFRPGMSMIHRAGLGGLACTLMAVERLVESRQLDPKKAPGGPWNDGPPWTIEPLAILLRFGSAGKAAGFLEKLFHIAFAIRDNVIYLPGQYDELPPPMEVRCYLQEGITMSFLQHGKVRKLGKPTAYTYHPEGPDGPAVDLKTRRCNSYKHQDGWKDLVSNSGSLKIGCLDIAGPLNPGAVVRHVAFSAHTKIEEPPELALPLHFALVGCLALAINRGSGVLLVPEVTDLVQFARLRPGLTPSTARHCRIVSAGDAALQAHIRLRAKHVIADADLPACDAITFESTPWASQQKSRVRTLRVPPGRELDLDQFATVLQIPELAPRLAVRPVLASQAKQRQGQGKKRDSVKEAGAFWADSIVRPLIADNLAGRRRWYEGFVDLMRKVDPVSKRPLRDRVLFERKGLKAMIEKIAWTDEGEATVVKAMHEALRRRYGAIAEENKGNPVAMKNRWRGEYDRWRLAFAGAKTPEQFRRALCDLLSRAGVSTVLQAEWQRLLPMLREDRWQLTRDLALVGLASYTGRGMEGVEEATSA